MNAQETETKKDGVMVSGLVVALQLLAITAIANENTPAREYTMVNMDNGLTSTMSDIGTTSFTFTVEWSYDLEIPGDKWLFLMGRLDLRDVWSFMAGIEVDPTQRKTTFEIPYCWLPEEYYDFERAFEGKAFFHISVPPPDDTGWIGPRPEEKEETQGNAETEQGEAQVLLSADRQVLTSREGEEKLGIRNEELGIEKQEPTNRLWLYLAVLPFILAVLYLMRRKKT